MQESQNVTPPQWGRNGMHDVTNMDHRERGNAPKGGSGYAAGGRGKGGHADEHDQMASPEAQSTKKENKQHRSQRQDSSWSDANYNEDSESLSIEQHVRWLERSTNGKVDDRALRSLWALPAKDSKEALRRVEDMVREQGGHCDNLSSILQSVCRKIEKWSNKLVKKNITKDESGVAE